MRNAGRKTVPGRLPAGQYIGRQPAQMVRPMITGPTPERRSSIANHFSSFIPDSSHANFGAVRYGGTYPRPAIPPHAVGEPPGGFYPHEQSKNNSLSVERTFSNASNDSVMDFTPPPMMAPALSQAAPRGRKTIDITRGTSSASTPSCPLKGRKLSNLKRRTSASKQPRSRVAKNGSQNATPAPPPSTPARPKAKRGRPPKRPTEDRKVRYSQPSEVHNGIPSPAITPTSSIDAAPAQSTRSTRRHPLPEDDPTESTPLHTAFPSQDTTVNGYPCKLDPQTGNPVASTYGPYAVSPELHGIRRALGEANWEDYITLVEALETGRATEDEVAKKESSIFQCRGKGARKKIRGMVRDMVLSGLGQGCQYTSVLT